MSTPNTSLAVVTGASSGIGLELARQLADHGFDLVVAAEDTELAIATEPLRGNGAHVEEVRVDLATFDGVEELAARLSGRVVDALVINAGVGVGGPFVESALGDQFRLVDLNVRSSVHLARRLLPDMVTRGAGRVLFTSSIAAVLPGPYQATYNASKSFLLSFSEALREELKDSGVTVTALMPGPTDTEFFERAGMTDTKLGQTSKDDPAQVAKEGFEAMMAGKHRVVAGSASNKAQVAAANVLSDPALAAQHGKQSKPGNADD